MLSQEGGRADRLVFSFERIAGKVARVDGNDDSRLYEGAWLGGETFVSFDKQAVSLLSRQRAAAQLVN